MTIEYKRSLKLASRTLRSNSTNEEIILWSKIRKNQILDIRFYRQKPITGYILDFYAPKIKLAVELDGSHHFNSDNIEYDINRDKIPASCGIVTKRYTNSQIRYELNSVLQDIYQYITEYKNQ